MAGLQRPGVRVCVGGKGMWADLCVCACLFVCVCGQARPRRGGGGGACGGSAGEVKRRRPGGFLVSLSAGPRAPPAVIFRGAAWPTPALFQSPHSHTNHKEIVGVTEESHTRDGDGLCVWWRRKVSKVFFFFFCWPGAGGACASVLTLTCTALSVRDSKALSSSASSAPHALVGRFLGEGAVVIR